jgi:hypothetical protein
MTEMMKVEMREVPGSPLHELEAGVIVNASLGKGDCAGMLVLNEVVVKENGECQYGHKRRWYIPLTSLGAQEGLTQ